MNDIRLLLTMLIAAATGCARSSEVDAEISTRTERAGVMQPGTTADEPSAPALDAGADPSSASAEDPTAPVSWIFTNDLTNARDLGGVPLLGSTSTSYDELYRGQALTLSPVGCEEFAALGIRTVVDLRGELERFFSPNADCVQSSASILEAPLGSTFDYLEYISTQEALGSIAATFAVLGNPDAYPVYMHCTFGRDRTGVMSALVLSALGAPREAIMAEYNRSSATVGAYPERLEGVLDELDAQGGVEAFLEHAGVTIDQIEALREIASAVGH